MVDLSSEDSEAIRDILIAERNNGTENPLLPMDFDVDGDGIADSFGLDSFGNLIVVKGVKLEDTLYESDGDDYNFNEPQHGDNKDLDPDRFGGSFIPPSQDIESAPRTSVEVYVEDGLPND